MQLLYAVPASQGQLTFFLPKKKYGLLAIEYELDAAASVTLTRANMGNVQLIWNGDPIINVDAELLNLLGNVYGGVSEFSSATGAACRMMVYIPTGTYFDSLNIYDVAENDQVNFKLDFPDLALAANVDSGMVRVYGKEKAGVMNYLYNLISRNVVASGASTLADTYPLNNVSQIILKNPAGSNVTDLQIKKDGRSIIDCPVDVLNSYSDWIHQLEATNTTIVVELAESKSIREVLGASIEYKYVFSGAGTLSQYFGFLDFTPAKSNKTQLEFNRNVGVNTDNVAKKSILNKAGLKALYEN
jgi:hypothetical protein